ncbi:autoinducer 2 ABC transporter substrate-binding protein [Gaiella occulta]|uniref:autoinducer 2 ABC transporter substrate-binding protein n=1 Tax=Gaiella occulta TaxID=1002870 RepID=UPI001C68DD66|nr:autoinducer 2 ABC transporter substrate-binding protein [Gaiella occulta]
MAAIVLALAATLVAVALPGGSSGAAQKRYKIAFVPKLIGIPYFNAMQKGGQAAAKKLGVDFIYQGPTTADSAKQIEIIDSLISRRVDAIAVAPNDAVAVKPILARAKAAGIKTLSSDTDAAGNREVWVNQASGEGIGVAVSEALASQMGGKGKWAIVSCGPTAQNLNSWIAVQKRYIAKKYPKMKLVTVVYAGEDQAQAVKLAKDLMTANPDLSGLVGQCSVSAPGVAQAITEMKKIGKVFSTGISTPTVMAPYIKSGAQAKVVLWNPVNLGYLTVWAAKYLADGKTFKPGKYNVGGPVGTVTYYSAKQELRLGPPTVFTKANIAKYEGLF